MTYFGSTEWFQRVADGLVSGYSLVHKFGASTAVSTSYVPLTALATIWQPTAATTVRIKAGGNANDTAAGTGARSVTVEGLDSSFARATETIATNGASASSSTSTSFIRIDKAYVETAGAYKGVNAGTITIEITAGGTDVISIPSGESHSTFGFYAIPINYKAWLLTFSVTSDTTKITDVRVRTLGNTNDTTVPVCPTHTISNVRGIAQAFSRRSETPRLITPTNRLAPMDFYIEAKVNSGTSTASCYFELLLKDIS